MGAKKAYVGDTIPKGARIIDFNTDGKGPYVLYTVPQ